MPIEKLEPVVRLALDALLDPKLSVDKPWFFIPADLLED